MPHDLTDSSTFTDPVAVPSAGDTRNAASVETPFQAVANRTRWLYDLVFGTGAGVKRIQRVASLAALKALTPIDHDVALWDAVGLYEYSAASAAAADDLNIITPDSGTGRWFVVFYGQKGAAKGLAALDATAGVVANATGNGNGGTLAGAGTGAGLDATGGGTNGIGVDGQGQGSGAGLRGSGGATGHGVEGYNGASGGHGVYGYGSGPSGTFGIYGTSENGAGVHGEGFEDNAGVEGVGSTGPGVDGSSASGPGGVFSGNATRAALKLVPQSAPSSGEVGDVYMDASGNIHVCTAAGSPGTWRTI